MNRSLPSDGQRIYRLYFYLCSCLAMARRSDGKTNSSVISSRLSEKSDFRKFVSKLLQSHATDADNFDLGGFGKVTTGDVVAMLIRLDQSLQDNYRNHEEPYTRLLSPADVLTVLGKLVELTPQERQDLGLDAAGDGLTLLQRALLILQTIGGLENYEMIFRLYKATIGLDFTTAEPCLNNLEAVDQLIEATVEQALHYLPERSRRSRNHESFSPGRGDTIRELTYKAQREVRRLLARSGNQGSFSSSHVGVDSYIQHYFQPGFVVKLAQTVVANERLTHQFPVYLKRITIEATGPLPFADKAFESKDQLLLEDRGPYPALLHPSLRKLDHPSGEQPHQLPGPGDYELASQEANRVVAEFYVKLPAGYPKAVSRVFDRIASEDGRRIDFSLSSTGIGGALSHVIKVINVALLFDIPCLKDYFSIAHDVTSTQAIIRENVASPIWAHSLVKLCQKKTVGQAIQLPQGDRSPSYEDYAFADPIGHGDYCGFDFLSAQAQASLQARLQAIRNAGVSPEQYLQDFCHQTEYQLALKDAWTYLQGYPFSSLAMIGVIEQEILSGLENANRPLTKEDPYIYFNACLSIAEALLDGGGYRRAYGYLKRLDVMEEFVKRESAIAQPLDSASETNREIFSGALLVRYLLCWAHYYYLYDVEDGDPNFLPPNCTADINREGLIRRSWQALEQAEQHIGRRLRKYVVINEVSQGTFHPHYNLLARMAFLRAKLLLFFSRYVPAEQRYLPTDLMVGQQRTRPSVHWGRLHLTEKARLYAAADGNGELYACYAAMQCWMYLITAYADPKCLTLTLPQNRAPFTLTSREELLAWARKLRDHALISYAEIGRQCYYQIKEKSGLPNESDGFGSYQIQKIKPIYEARGETDAQLSDPDPKFLVLDMSLLAIQPLEISKISPYHPDRSIYLFGSNACYLFFARGLYLLCSNQMAEFGEPASAPPLSWDDKLNRAMRLLNMAWAIAEEGAHIESVTTHPTPYYTITRPDPPTASPQEYSSPDVDAIRHLYPRRITEIADLGKMFSAACMVLRLYTLSPEQRPALATDIDRLLYTLQGVYRANSTLRNLLVHQRRYNGHLTSFFEHGTTLLKRQTAIALESTETLPLGAIAMAQHRDTLVSALFDALG